MIASGSLKVILITTFLFLLLIVLNYFFPSIILKILTIGFGIIFLFNFYFFRDPDRDIPQGDNLILSPADGTVIQICEVDEPYYFKKKVRRISIFLSVFNVHVNRVPISGKVDFYKYIKGKFLVAFADKASESNEQTVIGIQNSKGKVLFKQIAGIIARRIICNITNEDSVVAGERFGLIRYGSRADVFIPDNVEIKVKLNDKVLGGESVIGEFK